MTPAGPARTAPRLTNLGDLIDRARNLGKPAFIDLLQAGVPRSVSYAEFDAMADSFAKSLLSRGHQRGERIGILSINCVEFFAAYCGILRAGLVAVPVNFKFPRAMIAQVVHDAGAKLVICDAARRSDVPTDIAAVEYAELAIAPLNNREDGNDFAPIIPRDGEPAMFLYTSGTTGKPKGVVLSHQSHLWVATTRAATRDWSNQRLLIAAPLYHMNALALAQFASVAHATIVLMPKFDARQYIAAIASHQCTWLTAVPPMMAMMLREKDLLANTDLASIQTIRMGSAPVSQSLIDGLRHYFPQTSILNGYGTTEAGPVVFGPHPNGLRWPELSVGYPHPAVALRLVNQDERDAAEGVLEVKCAANMLCYHNLPEATRRATTVDGYYNTGDIFRRDEQGFHYFVGRIDDVFVSGGENIAPGEVEKMLERHTAIEQACVVPVADEIKGTKPVAFVTLKRGAVASEADIKDYALAHGPAYAHPRRVWFLDAMPLSGTNKVDRKAMVQEAETRLRSQARGNAD
ncbi:MAG: long-chain fatty acid--CoA ligase [Betaproteobacteria bacterium]|nr:long-chain fatty acid--CoA ligase [Betaproteobacteria bacterium]